MTNFHLKHALDYSHPELFDLTQADDGKEFLVVLRDKSTRASSIDFGDKSTRNSSIDLGDRRSTDSYDECIMPPRMKTIPNNHNNIANNCITNSLICAAIVKRLRISGSMDRSAVEVFLSQLPVVEYLHSFEYVVLQFGSMHLFLAWYT